ncbi:MAG: hypothetical protein U0401_14970 [Anaerolineae bacterium]
MKSGGRGPAFEHRLGDDLRRSMPFLGAKPAAVIEGSHQAALLRPHQ